MLRDNIYNEIWDKEHEANKEKSLRGSDWIKVKYIKIDHKTFHELMIEEYESPNPVIALPDTVNNINYHTFDSIPLLIEINVEGFEVVI